jgi:hypothetical protein
MLVDGVRMEQYFLVGAETKPRRIIFYAIPVQPVSCAIAATFCQADGLPVRERAHGEW